MVAAWSSYIEIGPFLNWRRMGRGAFLSVGVLTQRLTRSPFYATRHVHSENLRAEPGSCRPAYATLSPFTRPIMTRLEMFSG
jgi:hypothetical protein